MSISQSVTPLPVSLVKIIRSDVRVSFVSLWWKAPPHGAESDAQQPDHVSKEAERSPMTMTERHQQQRKHKMEWKSLFLSVCRVRCQLLFVYFVARVSGITGDKGVVVGRRRRRILGIHSLGLSLSISSQNESTSS